MKRLDSGWVLPNATYETYLPEGQQRMVFPFEEVPAQYDPTANIEAAMEYIKSRFALLPWQERVAEYALRRPDSSTYCFICSSYSCLFHKRKTEYMSKKKSKDKGHISGTIAGPAIIDEVHEFEVVPQSFVPHHTNEKKPEPLLPPLKTRPLGFALSTSDADTGFMSTIAKRLNPDYHPERERDHRSNLERRVRNQRRALRQLNKAYELAVLQHESQRSREKFVRDSQNRRMDLQNAEIARLKGEAKKLGAIHATDQKVLAQRKEQIANQMETIQDLEQELRDRDDERFARSVMANRRSKTRTILNWLQGIPNA